MNKSISRPTIFKIGDNILNSIEDIMRDGHLYYEEKILITQKELFDLYGDRFNPYEFAKIIFVKGGEIKEYKELAEKINSKSCILIAFGGGSVLDLVKFTATKKLLPYIAIPSTLSNDAIYSPVARLRKDTKKESFGTDSPLGLIVDLSIVKKSSKALILAGVGDLLSNISALKDWELSQSKGFEDINEFSFMISRSTNNLLDNYSESDIYSNFFLKDLTYGLVNSGLSMIWNGSSRPSSGSEHLISHAIDEFYPEKSSLHGIQVAWAFLLIEKYCRKDLKFYNILKAFYDQIGLGKMIEKIPFSDEDFFNLIPLAIKIRNRYTILNEYIATSK